MNTINDLISQLNEARKAEQASKDAKNALIEEMQKSNKYISAKNALDNASTIVENIEAEIKKLSEDTYGVDGNKHPHPKIEVRDTNTFVINDPAKVLAWVKVNLADALIYDAAKVKNYATKIGAVEGTEMVKGVQVRIASNLE